MAGLPLLPCCMALETQLLPCSRVWKQCDKGQVSQPTVQTLQFLLERLAATGFLYAHTSKMVLKGSRHGTPTVPRSRHTQPVVLHLPLIAKGDL